MPDLGASEVTDSSVTLSFTEVNDGIVQPASYHVRYSVRPISWGSASNDADGTCATHVVGTTLGARKTCTAPVPTAARARRFVALA